MDDACKSSRRNVAGFTLIELMVVVAILALSIYSIQSFGDLLAKAGNRAARQDFLTLLASARQEAVMRNRRLTLCRAVSVDRCAGNALVGAYDWQSVLLFVDVDRDRLYDQGRDSLVRYIDLPQRVRVTWNRGEAITYQPDGSVTGYSNGTFTLSSGDDRSCRVVLALSGRVRESCI